jgi:CheY-like chemotaxis protein
MPAKILVIDDAEHLRSILKVTLEFKGYAVDAAGDGAQGLAWATMNDYGLIFCDIDMPTMNGIEFTARYRAHPRGKAPVIMLTAEGSELIQKALAAGATAAISKPFEPIRVLQEVEKHLGKA